ACVFPPAPTAEISTLSLHDALPIFPYLGEKVEAVHVRQAKIEDDEARLLAQKFEPHLAVGCIENVVVLRGEPCSQEFADRRVIIDYKNLEGLGSHAAVSTCPAPDGTGSLIVNTAPFLSSRFAATMVPFIASMKPRAMARPNPVPARTRSPFWAR